MIQTKLIVINQEVASAHKHFEKYYCPPFDKLNSKKISEYVINNLRKRGIRCFLCKGYFKVDESYGKNDTMEHYWVECYFSGKTFCIDMTLKKYQVYMKEWLPFVYIGPLPNNYIKKTP